MRLLARFALVVFVVSIEGCSANLMDGRFTCSPDEPCPSGFSCRTGLCYRGEAPDAAMADDAFASDAPGETPDARDPVDALNIDASTDAPSTDAPVADSGSDALGADSGGDAGGDASCGAALDPLWQRVPSAPAGFAGRSGAFAAFTGRQVILFGGDRGETTAALYDTRNATAAAWTLLPDLGSMRAYTEGPSAAWTGRELVVWGGLSSSGALTDSGYRIDPYGAGTWREISRTGAPPARAGAAAIWTGREVVFWGGHDASGPIGTGGRYNPRSDTWLPMAANPTLGTTGPIRATWTGREVFVWTDRGAATYDPRTNAWTTTSGSGPPMGASAVVNAGTAVLAPGVGFITARYEFSWPDDPTAGWFGGSSASAPTTLSPAVWTGRSMVMWGAAEGADCTGAGAYYYPPPIDRWYAVEPSPLAARHGHAMVWADNRLFVWGGRNAAGDPLADGGMWSGERVPGRGEEWRTISLSRAPSARHSAASAWTGRSMLVWGGCGTATGGPQATGAAWTHDGFSGDWVALPASPAAARCRPAYTWTGRELIVWGGTDGAAWLADGARYDPRTGMWAAVAATGAPPALTRPVATWEGDRMLVVGPEGGGLYDPDADTWSPLPAGRPTPATSKRLALWADRFSLVHGAGANVVFDRYDSGSEWAPLSFTGASALTSITEHSGVWTGRSYFVIGGTATGSMTYYSEAYEVDPLLGTATLASGPGATTLPREDAAVVWTGNEAWVFGGFDRRDDVAVGDAFAWDPASRTWRTLPSSGAPGARAGAVSVWTGGAWIVWGGYDGHTTMYGNGFRLISG